MKPQSHPRARHDTRMAKNSFSTNATARSRSGSMGSNSCRAGRTGRKRRWLELVLAESKRPTPRVLVGGLGMGFTLRAVLDQVSVKIPGRCRGDLPGRCGVESRGTLATWRRALSSTRRVVVEEADVADVIARESGAFDAVSARRGQWPGRLHHRAQRASLRRSGPRRDPPQPATAGSSRRVVGRSRPAV